MAYTNQKAVSSYICYESSLSYPVRRPGLVGFRMRHEYGQWLQLMHCASLLSQSRYFEDRQVYAHSMSHREVARLKDEAGKFLEAREAE